MTSSTKSQRLQPVSPLVLKKAARRLLGQDLVTPEVLHIQHVLGESATQQQIDDQVRGVRKIPLAELRVE